MGIYATRPETAEEYLTSNSIKLESGCVKCTLYQKPSGHVSLGSRYWAKELKCYSAHQLAYIVEFGDYDRKLWVLHTCHNGWCVNPKHLYLGTAKGNSRDMVLAGRCNVPKGERNGKSKLNENEVMLIKVLILSGMQGKEIADIMNVSRTTISEIKNGQRWGGCALIGANTLTDA